MSDAPDEQKKAQAAHDARDEAPDALHVATITVSDTRHAGNDAGGDTLRECLGHFGFVLMPHATVPDDPARVREAVLQAIEAGACAVVTTGGTGIAPRDHTYEAVSALLEKTLDGFGEAFRRLSWEQVGARSVLSRAVAGTARGALVFALPGSPKAVSLAVRELVGPLLPHAVALVKHR